MPDLTRWFTNRKQRVVKPVCLVVHAMGEYIRSPHDVVPAWDWLEQSGLSVHALVFPNGNILRAAHDEDEAYHAGKSRIVLGEKTWNGLNSMSLGAEFLVAGEQNYESLLTAMKDPRTYTDAQYTAGAALYAGWCTAFSLPVERIVRHSDIAGDDVRGPLNGKADPGFGWDMPRFHDLVRAALAAPPLVA